MLPEYLLRETTPADASAISRIIQAAFAEYEGQLDPPSGAHKETPEQIERKLTSACGVLAFSDAQAIACVVYEILGEYIYFGRLAVLPEHRGRGVAGTLVTYIEERACEQGITRVRLGVRVALLQIRARYERMGYQLIEERRHPGYDRTTFVILEKHL